MQDTSSAGPIYTLSWMDGRIENTGHLLLALHPPFHLILWDTSLGTKVWKKTYDSVSSIYAYKMIFGGRERICRHLNYAALLSSSRSPMQHTLSV